MNKETFLTQLTNALSAMDPMERRRTVQYYREILEDQIEEGMSEEDAVAGMEPVEEIAARLLPENGAPAKKKRRRRRTWLLIAASPPLLVAGVILLSLFIAAWSVILSLFAAAAALAICLIAGIGCPLILLTAGYPLTALFLLGAGLFCGALGIALFVLVRYLCAQLAHGAGRLFRSIRDRLNPESEEFA